MKSWKQRILFLFVAGVIYLLGQYFRGYWWPNFTWPFSCQKVIFGAQSYCDRIYLDAFGWPLIAAGEILAIVGVIILFANERGFRKWLRLSYWYVPLAVLFSIFVVPDSPLGLLEAGPGNRLVSVWFVGIIYILATLGIVIWNAIKNRA